MDANDPLPDWFADHYDAHCLGIPVTDIGAVPYRRRLEAREFHSAIIEARWKASKRVKAMPIWKPDV